MAATAINKISPSPVNGKGKSAKPEYPNDGTGVLKLDPWLEPFQDSLRSRFALAQKWMKTLNEHEGGLDKFSKVSICLGRSKDKKEEKREITRKFKFKF